MLSPICLFTYNRLEETKRTIFALKNNTLASDSDLFIFSDGVKNESDVDKVEEVRNFIKGIDGFKSIKIIESGKNKGLAESIIDGTNDILQKYGKVIVLEDDLISMPNFLSFMNQALDFYKSIRKVQSINGFSLKLNQYDDDCDIYFQQRPFSWGWATWVDRWDKDIFNKPRLKKEIVSNKSILKDFKKACGDDIVKMFLDSIYDRNNSWYVRWTYNHFRRNTFSVYPKHSLIENIGFGEAGTHCKGINSYEFILDHEKAKTFQLSQFEEPNNKLRKDFLNYFSFKHKLILRLKLLRKWSGVKELILELKSKI